jgi:hypothetical protein
MLQRLLVRCLHLQPDNRGRRDMPAISPGVSAVMRPKTS